MKKLFLLACALYPAVVSLAQQTTGTIRYEEVISMNVELKDAPAELAGFLPKESRFKKLLYYKSDASLYEPDRNTESQDKSLNSDGMQVQIHFQVPEDKIYTNTAERKIISQREFMTRKFIIASDFSRNWKMTGRQKKILNYPCLEAVGISDKDTITAWYTAAIPVASGPEGLAGLPGMILEASIGNDRTIRALDVKEGNVDAGTIKEPKGGKKVTEQEFNAIVEEKTKEMEKQLGGKGNMIFRVEGR